MARYTHAGPNFCRRALAVALATGLAACATADRVRLLDGGSISGRLVAESPDAVSVEDINGRVRDTPVEQVRAVLYDGEPSALAQARVNAEAGGYETALATLGRIDPTTISNQRALAEIAFLKAYAAVRLAEAGQGDAGDAGRELNAFLQKHPNTWRRNQAIIALGDLLVSVGRHDQAVKMYGRLAKAGSIDVKREAALLAAEALAEKGDHDRATELFDRVAGTPPKADTLARRAQLGKARSLAERGDKGAAIGVVHGVLRAAPPNDAATRALGYNTLGRVHEATDQPVDAVLAYLHTDLLFDADADTHAEALSRLAALFPEIGKPEAGADALARLRQGYASTLWARRAEPQPN